MSAKSFCKHISKDIDWVVIQPIQTAVGSNTPELTTQTNLTCGQAFRWRCLGDSTFVGIFAHRVWQVKQIDDRVSYRVLACPHWNFNATSTSFQSTDIKPKKRKKLECDKYPATSERCCKCRNTELKLMSDYLQLDVDLQSLFNQWKQNDKVIDAKFQTCPGIRVLRQNPTETLFSFLCSVNNSISRIVPMIEKMSAAYGVQLLKLGEHCFYDFPSVQSLATSATEEELRKLGFGYRARYIVNCARKVLENGGDEWMDSMRSISYEEAVARLIELPGVGRKVADCVCLMSLDKHEAVPVDTHVKQIALRDYGYVVKSKSLTNQAYKDIGQFFRSLWGSHAGWAQAVMFASDIKPLPKLYALE